jgi:hypothetical protein
VHDGEQLSALTDESEPLGPWRDESGRRCVHRAAVESLEWPECFAGNGASGSIFAIRIGFVTGLAATAAGLSTIFSGGFFAVAAAVPFWSFLMLDWAAARPGFATDFIETGFAASAGLSVDLAVVWGNATTDRAGTSRVSIFKLAS